jgi:hypothetical protein
MKTKHIAFPGANPAIVLLGFIFFLSSCAVPFAPERQYINRMIDHSRRTSETINRLQNLATAPEPANPAWAGEVHSQLGILRGLIGEARSIVPPPGFQSIHDSYLATIEPLDSLVGNFDRAMALGESAEMQQARQVIEQGLAALQDVDFQLDAQDVGYRD